MRRRSPASASFRISSIRRRRSCARSAASLSPETSPSAFSARLSRLIATSRVSAACFNSGARSSRRASRSLSLSSASMATASSSVSISSADRSARSLVSMRWRRSAAASAARMLAVMAEKPSGRLSASQASAISAARPSMRFRSASACRISFSARAISSSRSRRRSVARR